MVGLVSRVNRMSTGQVVAIWLVVAIILVIAAVVYLQNRGDGEAGAEVALEEGQQLVQVRRGDLVNQITSSGSIVFPNREELTFGTSGTIGEILVAEGDSVSAGQELARLDGETVAYWSATWPRRNSTFRIPWMRWLSSWSLPRNSTSSKLELILQRRSLRSKRPGMHFRTLKTPSLRKKSMMPRPT